MGPPGEEGLDLAQDARALVGRLTDRARLEYSFGPDRGGYLYVIDGDVAMDDTEVEPGDAAKVRGPQHLSLSTETVAEVILVDVPLEFRPVLQDPPGTGFTSTVKVLS
jgi:quercetin 2,3-dioxygenase